jgi:hypothetical protein
MPEDRDDQVMLALTITPDMTLSPLEGFVHNRVEMLMRHHDVPSDMANAIREAYLAGLQDGNLELDVIKRRVINYAAATCAESAWAG